jgi:hypothetical protein
MYFVQVSDGAGTQELESKIDLILTFERHAGAEFLAMPTYQALVRPSGGYALSHESFSSPRLAHNLGYVVSQTHMSIADCEGVVEHASSSTMDQLQGCLVDLRISRYALFAFYQCTLLIGVY